MIEDNYIASNLIKNDLFILIFPRKFEEGNNNFDTDINNFFIEVSTISLLSLKYKEYINVFSKSEARQLSNHTLIEYAINTGDAEFLYKFIYNLSANEFSTLRDNLKIFLKKGYIQRLINPAGAPILFISKKDRGFRIYVHYREFNKIIKKNRYLFPLIKETLDRFQRITIFTKLDIRDIYYKIRIKKGDEWKITFRTRYNYFEYIVISFGLANMLAIFQLYINRALINLINIYYVIYLDNIFIYFTNSTDYQRYIREILKRLKNFKLYLKLFKYEFSVDRVEFLGFMIITRGIDMEESRIKIIIN